MSDWFRKEGLKNNVFERCTAAVLKRRAVGEQRERRNARGLLDYIDFRSQSITFYSVRGAVSASSHAPFAGTALHCNSSTSSRLGQQGRMSRPAEGLASPHGLFLEIATPPRHALLLGKSLE